MVFLSSSIISVQIYSHITPGANPKGSEAKAHEVRDYDTVEILGMCKSLLVCMTINASWFPQDYVHLNVCLHKRCIEAAPAWWQHPQFRPI